MFVDEVAVIDEIQMMRDPTRSWAWTRALLGICADEVHVCGEVSAVGYLRELVERIGEEFQSISYKRLTSLRVLRRGIGECLKLTMWNRFIPRING